MNGNQFISFPFYMNQPTYKPSYSRFRGSTRNFTSFSGIITQIDNFIPNHDNSFSGCYKLMSLQNTDKGPLNFVVSPTTYFINHEIFKVGDTVTGFYDASAPAILIYPPQYHAVVMSKDVENQNITVDYFNDYLTNSDGTLKLNVDENTEVILPNDQPFNGVLGNKNLIVIYGATTKSIPAQTAPNKIIVICS